VQLIAEIAGKERADEASGSVVRSNRLFYFAIPPTVFEPAARLVKMAGGMDVAGAAEAGKGGWRRVVVEKPFGHDSESSRALSSVMAQYLSEQEVFRIDHYLGKEMVQNLLILRFANGVLEPLWNRESISNVQITFKEPIGVSGRAGYFDEAGIIRDVMQNHLTQVFSLVAMEPPVSLAAEDIRDEKVKVLRCVVPARMEDVVLGQYGPAAGGKEGGYLQDEGIPADSTTATFATAVLHINNSRWRGVPFILKCGKALNERKAEIRIQFKAPMNGLFPLLPGAAHGAGLCAPSADGTLLGAGQRLQQTAAVHNNELVIRIQPDEAVYLKMMCKLPGLDFTPVETELSLSYKSRYPTRPPPEAYARLLLDVIRGDHSQFVRGDELAAAWAVFTPLLHRIERERTQPILYPFGSRGPIQSDLLIKRYGYVFEGKYAGEWRYAQDPEVASAAFRRCAESLVLPADRLEDIAADFTAEMERGLAGDAASSIKMIPSYVTDVPTGQESGRVWAIDMGGSNLRVVEIVLSGNGVLTKEREFKTMIPPATMQAPAAELFDFIVDAMVHAGAANDTDPVGFTFSFPVNQTAVDAGTLIEWTKGFSSPGVVGHDVLDLLDAALKRRGVMHARLSALVNDTVGTVMARAYTDTSCKIGVILGTGTNAAYCMYESLCLCLWLHRRRDSVLTHPSLSLPSYSFMCSGVLCGHPQVEGRQGRQDGGEHGVGWLRIGPLVHDAAAAPDR
jgi:glucose-6-phosphate 1-dehydrogenase